MKNKINNFLLLKTNYNYLIFFKGAYLNKESLNHKPSIINLIDVTGISSEFLTVDEEPKVFYCWQAGGFLITLYADEETAVTITAYVQDEEGWRKSCLNNANFLYEVWMSLWELEWLGDYWYDKRSEYEGSSGWWLTDTPITVENLAKTLYEYEDWVRQLNKDREAGEWGLVDDNSNLSI